MSLPTRTTPPNRHHRFRAGVAATVLIVAASVVLAAACTDTTPEANEPPTVTQAAAAPGDETIRITDEAFVPDSVEVEPGAVVTVANDTDETKRILVRGPDNDSEDELSVAPGETVRLHMEQPGVSVLALPENADVTATIVVAEESSAQ